MSCSVSAKGDIQVVDSTAAVGSLISIDEAARRLSITSRHLHRILGRGEIATVRIDGRRLIPVEAVEQFVRARLEPARAPKVPIAA